MSENKTIEVLQDHLLKQGMNWWRGKRPVVWDFRKHMKYPVINCVTEKEKNLARAITALYIASKERN